MYGYPYVYPDLFLIHEYNLVPINRISKHNKVH